MRTLFLAIAMLLIWPAEGRSQTNYETPKEEFRGAWIASVTNLDWPVRGATTQSQINDLRNILDRLQAAGINAVVFQIRPEQDAFYQSETEPWSYWLTGQQGRAPNPFYDPLQLAIDEARKRGMELHAWFNPYRAERSVGNYTLHESHILNRHPEWAFTVGTYRQLDPGLPQVRDYIVNIIMDVVRRYDVDGVHMDDYFYPYPPNTITNQDAATFAEHNRGFTNLGDWRRDNVNLLIRAINDSVQTVAPHVKFGMSPFGIWRPNNPPGISGMDAYATIYADARAWLQGQWVDYITPQLYWAFSGPQDYERLANWWTAERNGRHHYVGIGAYKADQSTFSGTLYASNEVPRQLRFNHAHEGIQGSVIFRSSNITRFSTHSLADSLKQTIFRRPAIVPTMDWKSMEAPEAPLSLNAIWPTGSPGVALEWLPPEGGAEAIRYAIYRVPVGAEVNGSVTADSRFLIAVTGETFFQDTPPADETYDYYITALSRNSIESDPVSMQVVISAEAEGLPGSFGLEQNYPNPFNPSTRIAYRLDAAGQTSLRVFDVLGREVAVLVDSVLPAGEFEAVFDATNLASGTYLYVLEHEGQRVSQVMTLMK
jgi:uncharacterized lipoprotein YddW (UPF0748 family)